MNRYTLRNNSRKIYNFIFCWRYTVEVTFPDSNATVEVEILEPKRTLLSWLRKPPVSYESVEVLTRAMGSLPLSTLQPYLD